MEDMSAIQTLYDQDGLLDILLGVEKYLDDMDMYAYKNWIYGELVEGPFVSKYWVEVTFKFTEEHFPDPIATKILEKQGTKVFVRQDHEISPIAHPRSRNDMTTVGTQGGSYQLPKEVRKPVLLIKLQIPRRIVNPESFDEYKLIAAEFNSNKNDEMPPDTEEDMSMDNEQDVEQMDAQMGQQQGGMPPMGGM